MAKQKMAQPAGVYTHADYLALRNARRELADLLGKIDKAKACGVDCAMYEQMRSDIDSQLAAIEQHFMTPAPAQ
jgi:hypothetical protein